ncbi:DUF2958 domain-containing protein [Mesorhizobium sp. 131-2-5]|uniref:DUF2958 domain-containing protein n=1 Tax=Mesorhizobium sp. 131-2-5 TaxID=2744519 RepID=UPI001FD17D78|nr:DUF2958 domain-containing protein [Mesorhizobium sp. 131-2-5]
MPLLTSNQREQLLANGRQPGRDHVPVVKFFNPVGIGTWLATELDADNDTCFGLADLGFPEIGSFSLEELASLSLPFGMHIERDILFTAVYPLSAYAEAAHEAGSITTAIRILSNAARLGARRGPDAFPPLAETRNPIGTHRANAPPSSASSA